MKNPLKKVGLFATPDSMEDLQEVLSHYNGTEAVVAQTAAWMTWNLASKIIDDAISKSEKQTGRITIKK